MQRSRSWRPPPRLGRHLCSRRTRSACLPSGRGAAAPARSSRAPARRGARRERPPPCCGETPFAVGSASANAAKKKKKKKCASASRPGQGSKSERRAQGCPFARGQGAARRPSFVAEPRARRRAPRARRRGARCGATAHSQRRRLCLAVGGNGGRHGGTRRACGSDGRRDGRTRRPQAHVSVAGRAALAAPGKGAPSAARAHRRTPANPQQGQIPPPFRTRKQLTSQEKCIPRWAGGESLSVERRAAAAPGGRLRARAGPLGA